MRFHSTPESALNGEITILAIIETIAAISLYVWAGLHLGTFKYLGLAVISAPLMLFRTRASADWGLKLYQRLCWANASGSFDTPYWELNLLVRPLLLVGTPVAGVAIRVASTVRCLITRPHEALGEIPRNWLRQSVCTDFFHPPEIVPLEALEENRVLRFAHILHVVRAENISKVDLSLMFLPFIVIGWLPSLIYRVSFKATAIAYAPIIWLVHSTLQNPLPLKTRLERITKGEIEKTRRGLSWIIAGMLAAKLAFIHSLIDRTRFESYFPSTKLLETTLAAGHWPWWQITLGTDALLTFLLLYFADAALARLDTPHAWREPFVLGTLSTTSFLRGAFSLATMSHFFLLALHTAFPWLAFHLWSA